jgi:pectate lyase
LESFKTNERSNQSRDFFWRRRGMIKAFNNVDADIVNQFYAFCSLCRPESLYTISKGKISSLTDFDAYLATSRGEIVPNTVKSK